MTNIIGRVCIRKSDNKLIEFQSGKDKDNRKVLEENAIKASYNKNDIIEKEVTVQEYSEIMALQPIPEKQKKYIKLKAPDGTITEYEVIV